MSDHLFDPGPEENLRGSPSAEVRRKARKEQLLAWGVHPATGQPLREEHSCGECINAFLMPGTAGRYWKCRLSNVTRGPGSDIRLRWPACTLFDPRDLYAPNIGTGDDSGRGVTLDELMSDA